MSKFVDHVVEAAREFCQIPRPSFHQKMQLQDLLLAYLPRMSPEAIAQLCNLLASSKYVPKPVVLTLCEQPAHICRALLIGSPILSDEDFSAIIALANNNEHARVIARSSSLSTRLRSQLRALNDERVHQALDLRQRPIATHEEPAFEQQKGDAELPVGKHDEEFSALACERLDAIIHTAFADHLGLQLVSAQLLCTDLTSRNLPTAMRCLGLSEATAWNLYRRLARSAAYKEGVREAFMSSYCSISIQEARKLVGEWQIEELVAMARYGSAANDTNQKSENHRKSA